MFDEYHKREQAIEEVANALHLSSRTRNCLRNAYLPISTVADLAEIPDKKLLRCKGVGLATVYEIRMATQKYRQEREGGTFDEYQERSRKTAVYPRVRIQLDDGPLIDAPWLYPLLGLLSEAGKLAGAYKRVVRDRGGAIDPDMVDAITGERGDVMWYGARLAVAASTMMREDAEKNITKLESRQTRASSRAAGTTADAK